MAGSNQRSGSRSSSSSRAKRQASCSTSTNGTPVHSRGIEPVAGRVVVQGRRQETRIVRQEDALQCTASKTLASIPNENSGTHSLNPFPSAAEAVMGDLSRTEAEAETDLGTVRILKRIELDTIELGLGLPLAAQVVLETGQVEVVHQQVQEQRDTVSLFGVLGKEGNWADGEEGFEKCAVQSVSEETDETMDSVNTRTVLEDMEVGQISQVNEIDEIARATAKGMGLDEEIRARTIMAERKRKDAEDARATERLAAEVVDTGEAGKEQAQRKDKDQGTDGKILEMAQEEEAAAAWERQERIRKGKAVRVEGEAPLVWRMLQIDVSNLAGFKGKILKLLGQAEAGEIEMEQQRITELKAAYNGYFLQNWWRIKKEVYEAIVAWAVAAIKELGRAPRRQQKKRRLETGNAWANRGKVALSAVMTKAKVLDSPFHFKLPVEIEEASALAWKKTVVGFFPKNHAPKFQVVRSTLLDKWGGQGLHKILLNDAGYYFLMFDNEEESIQRICEDGFVNVGGLLMHLDRWEEQANYNEPPEETANIWIVLRNLPPNLINPEAISCIAALIGRPICLDSTTEELDRISFARVCIEITPKSDLPHELILSTRNDQEVPIRVQYGWRPHRCVGCYTFGHAIENCPKAAKQVGQKEGQMNTPAMVNKGQQGSSGGGNLEQVLVGQQGDSVGGNLKQVLQGQQEQQEDLVETMEVQGHKGSSSDVIQRVQEGRQGSDVLVEEQQGSVEEEGYKTVGEEVKENSADLGTNGAAEVQGERAGDLGGCSDGQKVQVCADNKAAGSSAPALEERGSTEQQDELVERVVIEGQKKSSASKGQQGPSSGNNPGFQEGKQGSAVVFEEQQGLVEGEGCKTVGEEAIEIRADLGSNGASEVQGEKAGDLGEDRGSNGQEVQVVDDSNAAGSADLAMGERGSQVGMELCLGSPVRQNEEEQGQEGGEAESNPNDRALVIGAEDMPLARIHPVTPGPGNRTQNKVKQAREADEREGMKAYARKGKRNRRKE